MIDRRDDGSEAVRVLVVIDTLGPGGAEQSMLGILPLMATQGIAVEVAIRRAIAPDREEVLRASGVPVRLLESGAGLLGLARSLRREVRSHGTEVLHVALFEPVVAGAVGALGTGVPVLASMVSTPPDTTRDGFADTGGARWKVRTVLAVEGFVLRHLVDRVHAVTPGVRRTVSERFRVPASRITVAERGRDGSRFAPRTPKSHADARAELDVGEGEDLLVAIGRHEPAKGFLDLIDAFAVVAAARPQARLWIAGREGSSTEALKERIERFGFEDRVSLLGDRTDPERLLAAADVFVLSSRREGASGVAIEAMASGAPMVATELDGLEGIIVDGLQATTVPIGDPSAMGRAIVDLLEDPAGAARLGRAGRSTYEERFTMERSVAAFADLYRSVAAAGR